MKTLIIGATGTLGKEIADLCKERGDEVVATHRKANPAIDIDDEKSLESFFADQSGFDNIICAAGNASFGKMAELNNDALQLGVKSKLLGQVNLVKHAVNKLNPGGVILLTGGMLAYSPWPATSNIAMVNAGLEGFVRAVSLELEDNKKIGIVHPPLIKETAEAMQMESVPWPSARKVAETYVNSIQEVESGAPVFVSGYSPN